MTDKNEQREAEHRLWEAWAEEARVAYRSEKHGLVFYDAGTKTASWVAWQAGRALLAPVAAPEAPTEPKLVNGMKCDETGMLCGATNCCPAATTASASGCAKCGSTEIHACTGEPIPAWTPEAIAEFDRILDEYETEPDHAPAPSRNAAPLDIIERVYKEADAYSSDRIRRAAYFSSTIRAALTQQSAAQAPTPEADACKTCGGEGWVRDIHDMEQGLISCEKCKGSGRAAMSAATEQKEKP